MTGFNDEPEGVEPYPQLDNSEDLIDTNLNADELDNAYSPPDYEPPSLHEETTAEEVLKGESLDRRLSEEVPDVDEATPETETQERSGRLVDTGDGAYDDEEADAVAEDVGIDGGGATAEEAAVHTIDGVGDNPDDDVLGPVDSGDDSDSVDGE